MANINVFAIVAILVMGPELSFSEMRDQLIRENEILFCELWKDSAYGKDPNRTERAAWVMLNPQGAYSFKRWPASAARNSETWKGPVPDHAVALVHTHPVNTDDKPSRGDILIAKKLKMIVYVISSRGIWSVDRNGKVKKERGPTLLVPIISAGRTNESEDRSEGSGAVEPLPD